MAEDTDRQREDRGKETLRAYCDRLCHHWKWFVSSSLLAVLYSLALAVAQAGGLVTSIWLITGMALAGIFVASIYVWKDEYKAKLQAMPPIAGIWTRRVCPTPDGQIALGITTLEFDGKVLSGTLVESDINHEIKGFYNAEKRQFDVTVARTHRLGAQPRKNQEATYWIIGTDTLLYYTSDNGEGHVEQGTYRRQGTKPLWGPWMVRHAPTPDKPQNLACFREKYNAPQKSQRAKQSRGLHC